MRLPRLFLVGLFLAACAREDYSGNEVSTAVATEPPVATETTATAGTATTAPSPDPHGDEALPPTGAARRIELREAWDAVQRGDAVIVDVRGPDQYRTSHIKDAIHIPEAEMVNRLAEIPMGKMIITYCT